MESFATLIKSRKSTRKFTDQLLNPAFGVVAMVAMTPLITIQVMGLYSKLAEKKKTAAVPAPAYAFDLLDDDAIIEL